MSTAETQEIAEVLDRIKTWSPSSRLSLARRILETLDGAPLIEEPPRKISLDQIVGFLKTDRPAPTDEECDRILEEELMKKYGL